jgi:hypothetical protein
MKKTLNIYQLMNLMRGDEGNWLLLFHNNETPPISQLA